MKEYVSVLITAGGFGSRIGGDIPKQFLKLGGKLLLAHVLDAFELSEIVSEIILIVPENYTEFAISALVQPYGFKKVTAITAGGANRQASVYKGLQMLEPSRTDIVLIHDGARPFVNQRTIAEVAFWAGAGYAAVAGVKSKDTVKLADEEGLVWDTPNRENVWQVQTPQGFLYDTILQAHEAARKDSFIGTDDAMLVERLQCCPVKMVQSDYSNLKITTPEDFLIGESLLNLT